MKIDLDKATEFIEKDVGMTPISQSKNKKSPPYQIVWKGVVVKLRNGKCVWPNIGAAKTAFRGKIRVNSLIQMCCDVSPDKIRWVGHHPFFPYGFDDEAYQEILFKLQEARILEFRPVQ